MWNVFYWGFTCSSCLSGSKSEGQLTYQLTSYLQRTQTHWLDHQSEHYTNYTWYSNNSFKCRIQYPQPMTNIKKRNRTWPREEKTTYRVSEWENNIWQQSKINKSIQHANYTSQCQTDFHIEGKKGLQKAFSLTIMRQHDFLRKSELWRRIKQPKVAEVRNWSIFVVGCVDEAWEKGMKKWEKMTAMENHHNNINIVKRSSIWCPEHLTRHASKKFCWNSPSFQWKLKFKTEIQISKNNLPTGSNCHTVLPHFHLNKHLKNYLRQKTLCKMLWSRRKSLKSDKSQTFAKNFIFHPFSIHLFLTPLNQQ